METVEFHTTPDGKVVYKTSGSEEKRLTKFSRNILMPLMVMVKVRFPECYSRLITLYDRTSKSKTVSDETILRMMERFIRCNFGEHDLLTQDIVHDILHFEEVKCPLRGGFCHDENIICKPRGVIKLSPAEKEVAELYVQGFTFKTIAERLDRKPATVKTYLLRIKGKLKVKNCREIIQALRMMNL